MMPRAAIAAVVLFAAGIAGCGDDDDFANEPRPPAPIVVSASISAEQVSISPSRFGAGTISLIVTNQTDASQRVTLRSQELAAGGQPLEQSTGPINPGDTASLKADLDRGTYVLSAGGGSIEPVEIDVGAERESAQDRLLQP
jgi:hypothetical protein